MNDSKRAVSVSIIGIMTGVIVGWAVEFGGVFMIIAACFYGILVADFVLKVAGHQNKNIACTITGISMLIGALSGRMAIAAIQILSENVHPPYGVFNVVVDLFVSPISLIALITAIASTLIRMRYVKCGNNC